MRSSIDDQIDAVKEAAETERSEARRVEREWTASLHLANGKVLDDAADSLADTKLLYSFMDDLIEAVRDYGLDEVESLLYRIDEKLKDVSQP